jgi:hypothetical protein
VVAEPLRACLRRGTALVLALLLVAVSCPELLAQQGPPARQLGNPQQDYSSQIQSDDPGYAVPPYQDVQRYQAVEPYAPPPNAPVIQPLGPERLEQLVAPIALYPDTLVALVLTASTYPAQVQDADRWRQSLGDVPPEQIAAGADAQNWDPSVKALTAFPQVLALMDQNLAWTTDLGTAYFNQPSDVLQAVQQMRARAQAAGSLQPTLQEAVNYVGGNIVLAPPTPQVVYVPAYNPWVVYGEPVAPYPGFSFVGVLGDLGSNVLQFGVGIATTAFTSVPWGLLAWGVSWLVQAILFHDSNYYSRSTMVADWGFPHGGWRAANGGFAGRGNGYRGLERGYGNAFVHRPPSRYGPSNSRYNATRVQPFVHRPPTGAEAFVHRPPSRYGFAQGYNAPRPQALVHRPSNGYSGYRPAAGFSRSSPGFGYSGARQSYAYGSASRAPFANRGFSSRPQRPTFAQRPYSGFSGRSYGGNTRMARSSGFHPFSGGHSSGGFGGGHAPKMKGPKFSGGGHFGGHAGGGGHSGGHSGGGKHHR